MQKVDAMQSSQAILAVIMILLLVFAMGLTTAVLLFLQPPVLALPIN